MTNREWLFSLPLEEVYAWFDSEHVEAPNGTAERLSMALDAKSSACIVNDSLLRTVDELMEEVERYRELLGRAVDNAHATVVLLDGEAVG